MDKLNKNPLAQLFGGNMRKQRLHLGMSQEELAYKAGLHRNYISDVERGRRNVSIIAMGKIAAALNLELYELLK